MRCLAVLLLSCLTTLHAQDAPVLTFTPLAETFAQPTDIAFRGANTETAYIVEKRGRVFAVDQTTGARTLFLDLSDRVDASSEGGLLGLAFHPNADSNYCYVNYTVAGSAGARLLSKISRFPVVEGSPVLTSEELNLLSVPQPAANHNAGDLAFGPDGYLYIPFGDGGGGYDPFENGQNPRSLLGKLLRIDVNTQEGGRNYAIPADNPFANSTDTLGEIWSLGLRNPWRISFDRQMGDLWIADVGQNTREEVDVQAAGNVGGQNYGWNCREGFIASPQPTERYCGDGAGPFAAPELDYPHSGNSGFSGQSITGGYVYRGAATALQGVYVFGDFAAPRIFLYDPAAADGQQVTVLGDTPINNVSTFGEAADGTLYVADYGGTVYRIGVEGSTAVGGVASDLPLSVFPNPARSWVTVDLPASLAGGRVVVVDATGRRVEGQLAIRRAGTQLELNLETLPAGVYSVRVSADGVRGTARVIVR